MHRWADTNTIEPVLVRGLACFILGETSVYMRYIGRAHGEISHCSRVRMYVCVAHCGSDHLAEIVHFTVDLIGYHPGG